MEINALRALAEDWPAPYVLRTLTVPAPAAGTDWSATVPGESCWALVSASARLVNSAAAANRTPAFTLTDGTTTLWKVAPGVATTANLTTDYSWLSGWGVQDATITGGIIDVALPPLIIQPGWTVGVVTGAIDTADQWSNIVVQVVEVFTGEREHERAIAQAIVDRIIAKLDLLEGKV